MKIKVALAIIFSMVLFSTIEATTDRWVLLGRKTVNYAAERDQVPVTKWSGEFKKVQLRVKESGVHFIDLTVVFANGRRYDVPIKAFIPAGGSTRIIDLPGKARFIQRLELIYQTPVGGAGGKGLVEVWGLRN